MIFLRSTIPLAGSIGEGDTVRVPLDLDGHGSRFIVVGPVLPRASLALK
jgi:hypothetical protein